MRKVWLFLALFLPALAFAESAPSDMTSTPAVEGPAAELTLRDAVVLGVVEGITEFLPISSTGHLIIATRALGLESDIPLLDSAGRPLWFKKPSAKNPAGEPLTLRLAANTFNIVVQFGAIAAVALLYWPQLLSLIRGVFGRDRAGLRLLIHLLIAFFPAAILGLLANDWIDENLFSVGAVIVSLIVGAGLMFFAESWRRRREQKYEKHALNEMTAGAALRVGLLQCLALWPGMSRSMTTIVGGYFAGLDPRRSAEFSFLLGFVTMSAASAYKALKSGPAMIQVFGWSNVLLGAAVAAVTAAVCVRFLVHWLTRHGLGVFAWYRLGLAAVLAVLLKLSYL